jgi:isopenicillin-N N-acyltransferase-like protein
MSGTIFYSRMKPAISRRSRLHFRLLLAVCSATAIGLPSSAPAQTKTPADQAPAPSVTIQTNLAEFINRYYRAIDAGDAAGMRSYAHVHPGSNELARFEGSVAVLSATSRLRFACDKKFGEGKLMEAGYHCITAKNQIPADTKFKVDGDRATAAGVKLIRADGEWKQDFMPWEKLTTQHRVPLETVLQNIRAINGMLEQTTREVKAGKYISAADTFGILNARLHGQARAMPPLPVAYFVDLAAPASTTSSVPIIQLRGDPAALGKSHGEQLGTTIKELYQGYFQQEFHLDQEPGRAKYNQALAVAAGFENFLRPEHREEIRALAAETGLKPAEALLGQCFADLNAGGACSTVALPAGASADGIARFARNLDYETFGILEKHSVVLIFHPKDHYAFASMTAPGLVGVLSGINEHGLTVACMEVPRAFRLPQAMPFMLLYRTLLENCKTVDEAIALLEKTPRQSANNLMVMDASGDRALVEITPDKVVVRRAPDTAALVSTNHHRGQDLDSPGRCERYDFLHDAARREFGHLTETSVEELLGGAAQGGDTFQSMVFEPANRVMYLAVGAAAPSTGFHRVELKPLFK